jgi:glycosyltransferase involved in cell wall biosynthesis
VQSNLSKEGIRRILTEHRWRWLVPYHLHCWNEGLGWLTGGICRKIADRVGIDCAVGWIKPAEEAALKLDPNDVDLILASGPPFATFMLAERLSKKLGRPYVLDYRDPWTEPVIVQAPQLLPARLEAKAVAGAAGVTTVSESWARSLDSRYKLGPKVHVLTNGYDPEDLVGVPAHDFGHFAIVYAGIFYPPVRLVTPILAALQRLRFTDGSREFYFHYYGHHEDHVRKEAARLGVLDRVKLHGRVSRSEALSAIRGANVAVVINSVLEEASERTRGWVPAKLFEMLGLKTPILLIAPPGTDVESIASTAGLARRFSGSDIGGIVSFLEQLMSGRILTGVNSNNNSFAWESIGAEADAVLRRQLLMSQVGGV